VRGCCTVTATRACGLFADTLALVPAPEQTALLAELEAIADQTRAFVDATRAPNTVRTYASDWRDFLKLASE
jgi:hypothetical protein